MEAIKVYIENIGRRDEGEIIGAWFAAPLDEDEIRERLELNDQHSEYIISDFESLLPIGEVTDISEINDIYSVLEKLDGMPYFDVIDEIMREAGMTLDQVYKSCNDIILYSGIDTEEDLGLYLVEESGLLDGIPDKVSRYFDYASYGRDVAINGVFIYTSRGYVEVGC